MSGEGGKVSREKTIANTYLELHKFGQNKDYDKALKAAGRSRLHAIALTDLFTL